jgi:predicted Rossmann-fold nucleotide-binding protein
LIIIRSAIAVIAISGGFGTLSELAFALQLEKPVIGLRTWEVSENVDVASDPQEALEKLNKLIKI